MTVNFQAANYYSNGSYNPKKKINKAGFIGAGVGLATCAGLQYGGSKLLERNAEKILLKGMDVVTSDKKALTKIWEYIVKCALNATDKPTVWTKTGIAGAIGATIVGLASALSAAKKQLP